MGAQVDWRASLAVGGAAAMSSTALVSKLLAERRGGSWVAVAEPDSLQGH